MLFHEKVIKLRKEKHISQKNLADKLGIHVTNMNKYERGLSMPSLETLKRLSTVLDISIDYLLFDEKGDTIKSRIIDDELLKQFEKVSKLDTSNKEVIKTVIESIITKSEMERVMVENRIKKAS